MNTKFTLAIIALVGIGVFALPSTMSLFAGQHSFYNIDATGNQIPCKKCHGDIQAELNANADPLNPNRSPGPHAAMSCEECHRIELGQSSGDDAIWEVHYANGAVHRTLLISVYDFESRNIPETITNSDNYTTLNNSFYALTGRMIKDATISPSTDPTDPNLILTVQEHGGSVNAFLSLYDADGNPKDQNPVTQNSGVRLNRYDRVGAPAWNMNGSYPVTTYWSMGSRVVNPGTSYHAASSVGCIECHGGLERIGHEAMRSEGNGGGATNPSEAGNANCDNCHYGGGSAGTNMNRNFWAGGFGVTKPLKYQTDTGSIEAHNNWVTTQGVGRFSKAPAPFLEESNLSEVNNDACIACHTHGAVKITYLKSYLLELVTKSTSEGYIVSNAAVAGEVNITAFGNQSGMTFAVGDQSITWTSDQNMYINGQGTAVPITLNNEKDDSASALQP